MWNNQMFYLASMKEQHLATQFIVPKELLMAYLQANEQTSVADLQTIYTMIAEEMFRQYPIYSEGKMPEKVAEFTKDIQNFEQLVKQLTEIFKATANNATRSISLGSRLTKVIPATEIKIVYESITGLKVRKPKVL